MINFILIAYNRVSYSDFIYVVISFLLFTLLHSVFKSSVKLTEINLNDVNEMVKQRLNELKKEVSKNE